MRSFNCVFDSCRAVRRSERDSKDILYDLQNCPKRFEEVSLSGESGEVGSFVRKLPL
jgi:hypothetical protein